MGIRPLTLVLLLSALALGASRAHGDDSTAPPPPIPDPSDLTASAPPAPPAPTVPPEVSGTGTSTTAPPPLPDNSASTPVPTPVSAAPATPPVPSAPPPPVDALAQALALFKQKQYQDAIPLFKQAITQKPGDAKLYYYLGSCQYKAGRLREAVVNLSISYNLRMDLKLEDFVHRLRATLTSQEIEWVDAQVTAYGTGKTPDVPAPIDYPQFGVRLRFDMSFMNLAEFKNDAQAGINYSVSIQGTDPGYVFNASVPNDYVGYTLEPLLRLDPHFEIGLPFSYLAAGIVSEGYSDPLNGPGSVTYDLSAISGGLDFRILAGDRPFQFFASIGPRLASVSVDAEYDLSSQKITGNFNSTVFGGEAQVGLEWEFAPNFLFCPSIGYRWLQAGTLTGNLTGGGTTQRSRMEYDTNSTGSVITYVPADSPDPSGMSPFNLDLSGPTGSLTLSALF